MARGRPTRSVESARAAFEDIAESIPHIVWLASADGSTDYFNEMGTRYTGLPRQANYGWGWVEMVHSDDSVPARIAWEHATRLVTPFELPYRIRRSDGQFRWHAFRALPVRGPNGEVVRWIGTADDIHDVHGATEDDVRIETQTRQLRALLAAIQPEVRERFGFVDPAVRAARLDAALAEADAPRPRPRRARGVPQHDDDSSRGPLTTRELAVLRLLAAGYKNAEMAHLLGVSLRTVEASRARLRACLGLRTRAELVRFAHDSGLIEHKQ